MPGCSSPADTDGEYYSGIDFANREQRTGRCFLRDDKKTLTVAMRLPPRSSVKGTGVDCPFGTSAEFYNLLTGIVPEMPRDGSLELRATERWVRRVIGEEYETVRLWDAAARQKYGRKFYFHPTSHIQPSVGLRTVPACLYWLVQRSELRGEPLAKLKEARRGGGRVVEAHPRLFLYSLIERVHRAKNGVVTTSLMNSVASYKDKGKESHYHQRETVYNFLQSNPEWCLAGRRLNPASAPRGLLASDHTFDAWLSALTAWAAAQGETIQWDTARNTDLDLARVEIEGHILILDHERTGTPLRGSASEGRDDRDEPGAALR
jgi:hypothetical protein